MIPTQVKVNTPSRRREYIALTLYRCAHNQNRYMMDSVYNLLAAWLDCPSYIPRKDQTLNESALHIAARSPDDFLTLHQFLNLLQNRLTPNEQSNVIREIQCNPKYKQSPPQPTRAYSISHTPVY